MDVLKYFGYSLETICKISSFYKIFSNDRILKVLPKEWITKVINFCFKESELATQRRETLNANIADIATILTEKEYDITVGGNYGFGMQLG